VHIITARRLRHFAALHPDAATSLESWRAFTERAHWEHIHDVKATFASADRAGRLTVFNIGGNKYRLIVLINYQRKRVYIRHLLTHAEYSKEEWKRDPWY
jgi:mRNA interferase HigB